MSQHSILRLVMGLCNTMIVALAFESNNTFIVSRVTSICSIPPYRGIVDLVPGETYLFTEPIVVPTNCTLTVQSHGAVASLSGQSSTQLFAGEGFLTLKRLILCDGMTSDVGGAVSWTGKLFVVNCAFARNKVVTLNILMNR